VRCTPSAAEPGRSRLDRDTVLAAALDLADAEGLGGVTIRRLAKELGVTAMALYWHVADKQALLDAMADRLWVDAWTLAGTPSADDPWGDLRRIVTALVTTLRRHPMVATLLPSRFVESDASLELTEWSLDVLARLGFADRAADLAKWLCGSAMTLVTNQPGIAIPDPAVRAAASRTKRAALSALPPDRFPRLIASADSFADFGGG
jgi:TetR/AcrR family tetracycline transcriptional repressor